MMLPNTKNSTIFNMYYTIIRLISISCKMRAANLNKDFEITDWIEVYDKLLHLSPSRCTTLDTCLNAFHESRKSSDGSKTRKSCLHILLSQWGICFSSVSLPWWERCNWAGTEFTCNKCVKCDLSNLWLRTVKSNKNICDVFTFLAHCAESLLAVKVLIGAQQGALTWKVRGSGATSAARPNGMC